MIEWVSRTGISDTPQAESSRRAALRSREPDELFVLPVRRRQQTKNLNRTVDSY